MEGAFILIPFILVVAFAIGMWVLATGLDKNRITEYVQGRGGRVVSISWAPFGKGWFGEKNDRIYEVVYYDASGNQHFATCKTSFWSGVYWTDDRVTHRKGRWYDALSPMNEPGNPIIRQISDGDEDGDFRDESADGDDRSRRQPAARAEASTDIKSSGESENLVEELRRLREENERLRRELDRGKE
jgi:hypothetical protein